MNMVVNFLKIAAVSAYMNVRGGAGAFRFLDHDTARIFEDSLSRDACDALRVRIDDVFDEGANGRIWKDAVGSDSRILQFERDIPDLISHIDVEGCIEGIDAYLGRTTRSWLLMANRVQVKEGGRGSGGGLHRDSPFSHQVKCIWYLSDVGEDNGPFQYVAGTHRNLIGDRHKYPLGAYRFDEVADPLVSATATAGSLLVCDTRCIHGGKPIRKGVRYAITLYTFYDLEGPVRLFESSGLDPAICRERIERVSVDRR